MVVHTLDAVGVVACDLAPSCEIKGGKLKFMKIIV